MKNHAGLILNSKCVDDPSTATVLFVEKQKQLTAVIFTDAYC